MRTFIPAPSPPAEIADAEIADSCPSSDLRPQADNRHTIILVQTTANKKSRTFMDFEKVSMAMNGECPTLPEISSPAAPRINWAPESIPDQSPFRSVPTTGVCTMFEKRLKEMYPHMNDITYDIADLYNYVDALADLSAMVYDPKLNAYQPYNKEWVKKKCFAHLKKQAGQ